MVLKRCCDGAGMEGGMEDQQVGCGERDTLPGEGGMSGKRRCVYEGCRAWARAASDWCVAHPEGKPRRVGGAPKGNQNGRKHGWYGGYVRIEELKRALERPPDDLRLEIAVTRAVLADVMESDLSSTELLKALEIGMATLTRLMRTNKHLDKAGQDKLQDAVGRALQELGLGGT